MRFRRRWWLGSCELRWRRSDFSCDLREGSKLDVGVFFANWNCTEAFAAAAASVQSIQHRRSEGLLSDMAWQCVERFCF